MFSDVIQTGLSIKDVSKRGVVQKRLSFNARLLIRLRQYRLCLVAGFFGVLALSSGLSAKPYQIGPEDVLEIRFWQDPTLNAQVRVRDDGKIAIDIIGELQAAGLSEFELEKEIVRRISRINPQISQATLRVVNYNSRKVFVFGEVQDPGKYTFESIPDLWALINEAGGATDVGDLSRVRIIRGGEKQGKVEIVDVSGMISRGEVNKLPTIRSGDTIELLRTFGGVLRPRISGNIGLKNLYYIIGEVNTPGTHALEPNIDLLDAIALAGGPTSGADLRKVRVVSKDGEYSQVITFDIDKYTKTGQPARYLIRPEDTIVLPARGRGFLGLGGARNFIALASGITSMFLLLR
ncbi:SLBB domain-containing protein [bacterium AH-315-J21]|nr:SLBB domain-containing protein [bacterium AH-315-J21]